ncbi:MAG: hypothetical protein ACFCUE_09310 [Candidatus Bathyarchaeia archaeon]
MTVLLFVSLVEVGLIHFSQAQTLGTSVSGIIAIDTTWTQAGSPYTLIGNLLVNNDVTLTVQPGVIVNLGSYYIMVNGTLRAIGDSDNLITFAVNQTYSNPTTAQIIFTRYCKGWSTLDSSGCVIANANVNAPLKLSNSVEIIQDNIYNGIFIPFVTETQQTGMLIANNFIKGGISIGSTFGGTTILNNTLVGSGIMFNDNMDPPHVTVRGNTIVNCNIGISLGYWANYNNPLQLIENNFLFNNTCGIVLNYWQRIQNPVIQNNTIANNSIGISISFPSSYVASTLNSTIAYNNIYDNTKYNFENKQENTINVTYNWWGTTDTQTISQTIYDYYDDFNFGQVIYYPFLTAPNTQAPTYIEPLIPKPSPSLASTSLSPTPTQTPQPTTESSSTIHVTTDKGVVVDLQISGNITGSQMSNFIIATNQSDTTTVISFTLTGQGGTNGFSNITIPKTAIPYGKIPTIYIDNQLASNQDYTQDDNNYYVWYTAHFSTHQISIIFRGTSSADSNFLEVVYEVAVGAAIAIAIVLALVMIMRERRQETQQTP